MLVKTSTCRPATLVVMAGKSEFLRWAAVGAVLVLGVGACGSDDDAAAITTTTITDESTTTTSSTTTPEASSTSVPESTTTSEATTTTTSTPTGTYPVGTVGRLRLTRTGVESDGAALFGELPEITFEQVVPNMAAAGIGGVEGSPDVDTGYVLDETISPCAGLEVRRTRWGNLTIVSTREAGTGTNERFSGWLLDENADTGLTTPEGIRVGMTRADVETVYGSDAFGTEGVYTQIWISDPVPPLMRGFTNDAGFVNLIEGGNGCLGIAS